MGGKLLSQQFNLPEKRISREEYENLRLQLIQDFKDIYPDCYIDTPKLLKKKDSAGDLDLVVNLQADQVKKVIKEKWNIKPFINANVMSLPVNGFQVDVIFVDTKYFNSTLNFLNHGDTSNLIGRMANFQGLNWGTKGLFFKLLQSYYSGREIDVNPVDKVYISDSPFDVLTFLDLDYNKWMEGFDDENDVFNFIESSKYFNPRAFFFEELNSENRSRNKNRPMYARFVERVAEKYKDVVIPRLSKQYWFPRVIQRWPHILDEIEKHRPKYERQYIISKKWNGDLIKTIPYQNQELGKFIVGFKQKHAPFDEFILNSTVDQIKVALQEYEKKFISIL